MTPPPPLRFTDINGRRVSWRSVGTGPAVLLLHGSPQSSRALAGLAEAVAAAGLCAIMPDTPGAGHSEPLAKTTLTIDDLAVALGEFADTLGLKTFGLYGTHTGAAIACAFAARYPARVTALVFDGLAAWSEAERSAYITDYAPPFIPSADGAHLTWLWSRMEAQSVFFPWHQQNASTWRKVDLSPPWHLHRNAMDMLDSGDAYRALYQAALAFDPGVDVAVPPKAVILTLASDVLRTHASRPALAHLPLTLFDAPASLWRAAAAAMAATPGDAAPDLPAPALFWRGTRAGAGCPLVLLHQAGASSRVFADLLPGLAATRPVIAVDLPGHGFDESQLAGNAPAVAACIAASAQALGLSDYQVAGVRFGGVIAQAMASPSVRAVDLEPRCPDSELATRGAIKLDPVWDGSHLLTAWRVAWRQAIWDPWYRHNAAAARPVPGDLSPAVIHASALDLLRSGANWARANQIEAAAGPAAAILPGPPHHWPARLAAWR